MSYSSLKIRLGSTIEQLRMHEGLTKTKLGLMVGVSRQYVDRIEHGKANPTIDVLLRIAEGLDTTVENLLAGSCDADNDVASVQG